MNLLIFHPELTMMLAVAGIMFCLLLMLSVRTRLTLISIIALSPLAPIFALRFAAMLVLILTDRVLQAKWADRFVGHAQWINHHYGEAT